MAKTTKKKTSKTSAAKKPPAKKPTRRAAPAADTPVTLEEAKRLVAATQPRRAMKRGAVAEPSPAGVGQAREELEKERRDELARREREYKAVMSLMKRRGTRRATTTSTGGTRRAAPAAATAAFKPLQVLAEGDSWFDYPVPFFGGGIIPRLEKRLGVPILSLAQAGDETRYMLGVKQRKKLAECFTKGCPAGGPWEVMLFSGGGNDIVDNPMALWVLDWDPDKTPADHLHPARFGTALALVQAAYEDLIVLRDQLSPNTHLVFHGYDFAIPDGRKVCHLGPWLKPTFDLRGFPESNVRFLVVKEMLTRFAAMVSTLTAHPKVSLIPTQGVLAPQPSSWHNELHPSKAGYGLFADRFREHLKALFPDRVA